MLGDKTKKPLPIAVQAVAVNSKTGGKLKQVNKHHKCVSVNKLWTLIYNIQEDLVSTFGLVSSPTQGLG